MSYNSVQNAAISSTILLMLLKMAKLAETHHAIHMSNKDTQPETTESFKIQNL
jgi:hypothetical protein